ncbi:hypothetical protein A2609_01205 [Candidatus Kaiserbacteria bacterium RIFOXYD1_FULL_47_14]|uniref:Phosphoribosyltransferase domain-containing protein n=1 Tax=Candidatus Kaiserbacteria bacterium RIFOXYD1_FULL_47_14 TaxID=1798533 RepID=A0A1F6G6X1_9BACT|nr:MAG: hypothetical protein A2609_01205 [Candidatus Kaiserbacteria bacterium RIFOXYD1_FULL_47_14]
MDIVQKMRLTLAFALMNIGAVLTAESDHPLVVERERENGVERGFLLKLHEKNPEAPLSPFFLNLRTPDNPKPGPLTPEIVEFAARCMRDVQANRGLSFDATAGIPRAGDPFAKALARLYGMNAIVLEKIERDGKRCVALPSDFWLPARIKKALGVDDLITKADSKREAIGVWRGVGLEVTDILVLVDREQGGREELAGLGCTLHSVFTITELLDLYVDAGKMTSHLRIDIHAYLARA